MSGEVCITEIDVRSELNEEKISAGKLVRRSEIQYKEDKKEYDCWQKIRHRTMIDGNEVVAFIVNNSDNVGKSI